MAVPVGFVGLGSVSKDVDPLVVQLALSTHVLADGTLEPSETGATFSHTNAVEGNLPIVPRPGLRGHVSELRSTLAAFASLVAIAALISVCADAKSRVPHSDTAGRRLSNGEDSTNPELEGVCRNPTEEADPYASPQPLDEGIEAEPSAPNPKMLRLDTGRSGNASASSSTHHGQSQSESSSVAPAFSSQRKHRAVSPPSGSSGQAGPTPLFRAQQHFHASGTGAFPAASGFLKVKSADELAAASGLLLLSTQGQGNAKADSFLSEPCRLPQQLQRSSSSVELEASHLDSTRAALPDANSTSSGSSIVARPSLTSSVTAAAQQDVMLPSPQPSTSKEQAYECQPVACKCRFFRLPKVQSPGAHSQRFDVNRAMSIVPDYRAVTEYRLLARLLGEASLSPSEMHDAAIRTERLVACIRHDELFLVEQCDSSQRLIELLARRFLLLDVVVSALQIMSVPLDSWWHDVISRVPSNPALPSRFVGDPEQRAFKKTLIKELINAVESLKNGVRPTSDVLVRLKTTLFFSSLSPKRLKNSGWNLCRRIEAGPCRGDCN